MKKALPIILLAAALLLCLVGVVALGANFWFSRGDQASLSVWQAPLNQVDSKRINPANALELLADISAAQAIDDSLQQGDWESAFAIIAYSPRVSDINRAGTLLLLGSRYAAAKQNSRAAWCYQYAATVALLSPEPSDPLRVQTLLEAVQGLSSLGQTAVARSAVDQAYLIVQYSTAIPADSRARLFEQIAQLYNSLGASNLVAQVRQQRDQASGVTKQAVPVQTRPAYVLAPGKLPSSQELGDKTKARSTAAKELIDQLNLHAKSAADANLVRVLGDRLYEEDGLRNNFYSQLLTPTADPGVQAALLRDKIRWLAYKLMTARGAFGLSLVLEWETDASKISAELSDTFNELFKLSEQQAASTDSTVQADQQLQDVLRAELVAGRWGLYAYDEKDLQSRLGDVAARLRDDEVPALRLDAFTRGSVINYLLVPDELFGQGEKALPK